MSTFTKSLVAVMVSAGAAAHGALYQGSDAGGRSATVDFQVSGGDLIVTLTNVATHDVTKPDQLLTGVFFEFEDALTLSRTSAVLGAGSNVWIPQASGATPGPIDAPNIIGGEWAGRTGIGAIAPADIGISSAGLGVFGGGHLFPGSNLWGPIAKDGAQYGILSAGDDLTTGNGAILGTPYVQNQVVFTLSGNPAALAAIDLAKAKKVWFQYGTKFGEPGFKGDLVPTPGATCVLALGGVLAARRRRR
jgi:hypothetical protein